MRRRGFTLLEILVALAVLGLLLVLLGQGVRFGLQSVALQARAEAGGGADLPAADAALRVLIAHADPGIFPEPASLKGTAASLTLLTTLPGADGTSLRVDAVLFVSAGRLRLRWTPHRHVAWFAPAPPPQELTILDGVAAVRIAYATPGSAEWRPDWTAETLPALVRLELTLQPATRHWPPILVAPKLEALGQ